MVIGRVTGRRHRNNGHATPDVDRVTVDEWMMWCLETGRGRGDKGDTEARRESRAPCHVVGVGVRVERPRDPRPEVPGKGLVLGRESRRVDQHRRAIAEVDEIRRMAEALINEVVNPHPRDVFLFTRRFQ